MQLTGAHEIVIIVMLTGTTLTAVGGPIGAAYNIVVNAINVQLYYS